MFKIDQHIELLLLNHSCVIVPGFGGFVVHRVPARFDESDGMMLPPSNTVGFNPQLVINDSLLTQSFVEAYDMSYPEAQREVEHETQELRGLIADNGQFEIHSIGMITLNADGNYEFEPCEAGILSPNLYGLPGIETSDEDAFTKRKKVQLQPVTVVDAVDDSVKKENEDVVETVAEQDEDIIQIRRSTIRKFAVACAVMLVLVAIPFISYNGEANRILSGIDLSIFTNLMPKTEVKKPETLATKEIIHVYVSKKTEPKIVTKQKDTSESKEVKTKIETEAPNLKDQPTASGYVIVLAAQVTKRNAEIYINDLKAIGITNVRLIGEGKSRKVVTGNYSTEEEAKQARRDLANKADFSSAWVMKLK